MALTVSNLIRSRSGNNVRVDFDVAFDSSYAAPETLAASALGLAEVRAFDIQPTSGYFLNPAINTDGSSVSLTVYEGGAGAQTTTSTASTFTGSAVELPPQLVYEESQTSVSNTATLDYLPAHIMYVSKDGQAFLIVDAGTAPGAGEVAIDFSTGVMTFNAADSDPTVFVTYWPALSNKLLADNLVESDVVDGTPAAGHASISAQTITITGGAAAIIAVDVDGTPFKPLIDDDTAATGEYEVTWDSSGDTVLVGSGTEFGDATAITITFIKDPGNLNYVEDASAHDTDVVTIANHFYILRTSCWLYTDDDDVPHLICNSSETLAANEVKFDPRQVAGAKFTYHADTDIAASGIPYVAMMPQEIAAANTATGTNSSHTHAVTADAADEVAGATDLASLTVRCSAIGA